MNNKIEIIEEYVTKYQLQNRRLEKWISAQEQAMDDRVGAICQDFIQVVDAFDKAEETIHERGYDQSKLSTEAIKRLLQAKSKLIEVLGNYGVEILTFGEGRPDSERATVVGKEATDSQPEGTVTAIVHDGFQRRGQILRKADVIVASQPE